MIYEVAGRGRIPRVKYEAVISRYMAKRPEEMKHQGPGGLFHKENFHVRRNL